MIKSKKSHASLEYLSRRKKANKIISILSTFVDLSNCDILDIGTGSGLIIKDISKKCKSATSVDLYDERLVKSGYSFKQVNNEHLPFPDKKFDIIISNHIIEHIPNQRLHIEEIYRVLRKKGVLYLATPNKYWITDPHYKLLLISWLPKRFSSLYLKILKNKKWDISPLSYLNLKKLMKNKFEVYNLTMKLIKNPKKYNLDIFRKIQPIIKLIPLSLLKLFNFIVPTYILILKKK